MSNSEVEKLVIIGSGPAAWTAALYAARAELKPLVFAGFKMGGQRGGQLTTTTEVENYPGFPLGVSGIELVKNMEEQARRFNITVYEEDVTGVDCSKNPFVVRGSSNVVETYALIVATGAYARRMNIKGDKEFWNKGISACAVCDGALPLFRNQDLAVIGGGDSACEEASFLTKFGKKVYLILRRNQFRASKIMEERVRSNPKIEIIFEHEIIEAFGDLFLKGITLKQVKTGEEKKIEVRGLFYAIGHEPNSGFLGGQVKLDDTGYIAVQPNTSYTSLPGVFAAGDVSDKRYRQAVTAAGMGCMAAIDAERWLSEHIGE